MSSAPLSFPAAQRAASKSKGTSRAKTQTKRAVKKPTRKIAAKKKKTAKKTVTARARKPKKVAAKPKVTRTDKALVKPPKKPPGGYVIFLTKYIKTSDKPRKTLAENQILFAEAARVWNTLSDLEKQTFHDESAKLKAQYLQQVAAWSQRVRGNMGFFIALNRERVKKGKQVIHLPKGQRRPASSFIRFYRDQSASINGSIIDKSREAAKRWGALSAKEKEPYVTQAKKDMAKWKEGF